MASSPTKAATQFTTDRFATTKHFLHGASAGSIGVYSAAWSLQQQGPAPAGIVADSFVLNQEWGSRVQPGRAVRDRHKRSPT